MAQGHFGSLSDPARHEADRTPLAPVVARRLGASGVLGGLDARHPAPCLAFARLRLTARCKCSLRADALARVKSASLTALDRSWRPDRAGPWTGRLAASEALFTPAIASAGLRPHPGPLPWGAACSASYGRLPAPFASLRILGGAPGLSA